MKHYIPTHFLPVSHFIILHRGNLLLDDVSLSISVLSFQWHWFPLSNIRHRYADLYYPIHRCRWIAFEEQRGSWFSSLVHLSVVKLWFKTEWIFFFTFFSQTDALLQWGHHKPQGALERSSRWWGWNVWLTSLGPLCAGIKRGMPVKILHRPLLVSFCARLKRGMQVQLVQLPHLSFSLYNLKEVCYRYCIDLHQNFRLQSLEQVRYYRC